MLSLKGDPCERMTVRWRACVDVPEGFALYRPAGSSEPWRRAEAFVNRFETDLDESNFFFADMTGLSPDTAYEYTVGDGSYSDLTHVEIRAVPRLGYRFLRWNDGNTDNPRSVFLTQDTSFTAYFTTAEQFEVIVQAGNPYGYVDGGGTFFDGESTTLTAHDTVPGYRFLRWNDHNTDNPRTVVVTQDTIFTAFFSRQQGIDSPLSPLPAFTLSPNPAHTSVTVTLAAPCGSGCSLSLLDASGHTVLSLPLPAGSSNATLPLRDLPAGPYFVSLSSPQGSSSQKLILQ